MQNATWAEKTHFKVQCQRGAPGWLQIAMKQVVDRAL